MMLGALRRIMDRVQALQRIGDVRIEIGDDETDCIASALIVGWAHRNRHPCRQRFVRQRSEEHTSELQSLMRISYAVFCLKKKKKKTVGEVKQESQSVATRETRTTAHAK